MTNVSTRVTEPLSSLIYDIDGVSRGSKHARRVHDGVHVCFRTVDHFDRYVFLGDEEGQFGTAEHYSVDVPGIDHGVNDANDGALRLEFETAVLEFIDDDVIEHSDVVVTGIRGLD